MSTTRTPRAPRKPRLTPDGQWLTDGRLALGLCADQVAALLDKNPGRVTEWELGQNPIPTWVKQTLRLHGWP